MKRISSLLVVGALIPTLTMAAGHDKSGADLPTFVKSDNFGFIHTAPTKGDAQMVGLSAVNFLEDLITRDFRAAGGETFEARSVAYDALGKVHVRADQYINGLRVVGADMVLHADAATGQVESVNGLFAPSLNAPVPAMTKFMVPTHAAELAVLGLEGESVGYPDLKYFFDAETGRTHLTWEVRMVGSEDDGTPFDTFFYIDARSREVVGAAPQVHAAKSWSTYDAENNTYSSSFLPGTFLCSGSQSCGDAAGQAAHDGASKVYDYYLSTFGRDSIDGNGMQIISSVHVGSNWNNAVWYRGQMMYGDGDGSLFSNLAFGFDVIGHELTHGVTSTESNLVYANESGALNEAWSDIFGATAEVYRDGRISANTWLIGEEISVRDPALRYMDNPTLDGYSRDYYPERLYAGRCRPSNSNDQCGVHGNSGIANLAFYLLVEGGTHPRGKTTENVSGVGIATAEQVFYRANTTYMTSGTDFAGARTATAQAAADLFGQSVVDSVNSAWCAVGVGSCDGGPGSCSAAGASCSSNSDCCSNSCKGRSGAQTCK